MKWMKHVTDSINDPKIARLRGEFGNEGYAVYWIILEVIARQFTRTNPSDELSIPEKTWRKYLEISPKKFRKILDFCQKQELLEYRDSGNMVTIKVPKFLNYSDEYTRKWNGPEDESRSEDSGQTPDSVRASSSPSTSPRDYSYISSTTVDGMDIDF